MHLIIDACVFERNNQRGIARIFSNILPLMCEAHPDLQITLIFRRRPQMPYPSHPQIKTLSLSGIYRLRPWRFWKSRYKRVQDLFIQSIAGWDQKNIWFSTYFTLPPKNWHGKQAVFVHDMIYELFPEMMPESQTLIKIKKNTIIDANRVFCNSQVTATDLEKEYPQVRSKLKVAHLSHAPLFTHLQKNEIKTCISEKFLLYVGNRSYYKNFSTLIDAYAKWEKKKDIKLLLVGPNLSDEEESRIAELGLRGNIIIFAHADDQTLRDLYNQALALVYPSLYEGFGIPLLEAMACGCPVIASRIPSTLEVAQDVPFYFEPGNSNSLLNTLDAVTDKVGTTAHISRGFEVSSQYSWEKTAKIIYDGLKELND